MLSEARALEKVVVVFPPHHGQLEAAWRTSSAVSSQFGELPILGSDGRRGHVPPGGRRVEDAPAAFGGYGAPTTTLARIWTTPSCLTTTDTLRLRMKTSGVGHPNVRFSRPAALPR